MLSAGEDQSILMWDLFQKKIIKKLNNAHEEPILAFSISANEKLLISGGEDNKIRLWDLE